MNLTVKCEFAFFACGVGEFVPVNHWLYRKNTEVFVQVGYFDSGESCKFKQAKVPLSIPKSLMEWANN